jgi:hypothetical protein
LRARIRVAPARFQAQPNRHWLKMPPVRWSEFECAEGLTRQGDGVRRSLLRAFERDRCFDGTATIVDPTRGGWGLSASILATHVSIVAQLLWIARLSKTVCGVYVGESTTAVCVEAAVLRICQRLSCQSAALTATAPHYQPH